jgi:hypothetical protein
MTHVFLLWHTQEEADLPGGEVVKLLGVYSSSNKRKQRFTPARRCPGSATSRTAS